MERSLPDFLKDTDYETATLRFKWNASIEDKITLSGNDKILDAVFKLNYKAMLGFSSALAALIFWRLRTFRKDDQSALNDYFFLIEAGWLGLIDKSFLTITFDEDKIAGDSKAASILFNADMFFRGILRDYEIGSYFIYESISSLAALARHISPDKEIVDAWMTDCLKKSAVLFPAQYDVYEVVADRDAYEDKIYDSSLEPIITQDFYFTTGFDYHAADITALSQMWLERRNYKTNPYIKQ